MAAGYSGHDRKGPVGCRILAPGHGRDDHEAWRPAHGRRRGCREGGRMTARPSRWRAWAPDLEPLRESPAFRNLYLARTVSLFSVSILAVAVAWQVYELSASSLHVAGVTVGLAVGSL